MNTKDTGLTAFPIREERDRNGDIFQYASSGMTLRDYFAAHAPAAPDDWNETLSMRATYVDEQMAIALWNFEYADAMLKAREL